MHRTRPVLAVVTGGLLLALTACGGASSSAGSTGATGSAGSQPSAPASGAADGFRGGPPGANGEIAAVSGKTLQVQNQQTGQVAVTYTGSTKVTQQVEAKASDLAVGDCVMVTSATGSTSGSPSAPPSDASATITATTVRITATGQDTCDRGGAGRPAGAPSNLPSGMPSGAPNDRPSGAPSSGPGGPGGRGFGGGFGGAFGKVTAISASGFTVTQTLPGASGSSDNAERKITTSSSTTWTRTAGARPSALKVGRCVSAQGTTDDTGAVTATTISVTDKVGGACTGGFGFGRPGQGS